MTGNYPNHPLFRIAPLLDKGFQTARFDPYERVLVAKIRAGQYSSDLWDCNGLYLTYLDRLDGPADQHLYAETKSRYEMTPEQRRQYRAWSAEQAQEQRARRAAAEAQRKEELSRLEREWAERRKQQKAEKERRDRQWAEAEASKAAAPPVNEEREAVLKSRWECSSCHRPSFVMPLPEGKYQLTCPRCVRSATADHATMINIIMARNIWLKPVNAG